MILTEQEAEDLTKLAGQCADKLIEAGASSVLILFGKPMPDRWGVGWSQRGSTYESDGILAKYEKDRDYHHQAERIAQAMPKEPPDADEKWREA